LDEENASMFYRYACSFHWSIAQFTPAPVNYHPRNMGERVFAIIVLLMGFIVVSSFIGNVTALVTHARQASEKRATQDRKMRAYVFENKVSIGLSTRLSSFLKHNRRKQARVHEHEVEAFKDLPPTLLMQLRLEVHSPWLVRHPFFCRANELHEAFLHGICHSAIRTRALAYGDEVFHSCTLSKCMIFVVSGTCEYISQRSRKLSKSTSTISLDKMLNSSQPDATTIHNIDSEQWLCEASLWMKWTHRGMLTAKATVDILNLDAVGLQQVARRSGEILTHIQKYARCFVDEAAEYHFDENDVDFDDRGFHVDRSEHLANEALGYDASQPTSEGHHTSWFTAIKNWRATIAVT